MALETAGSVAIDLGLQKFLLILSVSLSIATLPQVFAWARQIPYTLLAGDRGLGTRRGQCPRDQLVGADQPALFNLRSIGWQAAPCCVRVGLYALRRKA